MKLLMSINTSWNVVNFRAGLIRGLQAHGYEVVVAAPRDRFSDAIERDLGCRFIDLPMEGHSRSPLTDLALLARFARLMRAERPDAYLGYTVKPNVFGSFAAQMFGVPCINNIAGLGSIFNESGVTAKIVVGLYRLALRSSAHVFFQNDADLALFLGRGLVRAEKASLLPGSGIDTARFAAAERPPRDEASPFAFVLVARLLKEKGLAELAEATRRVRGTHPRVRVRVAGPLDPHNPAAIAPAAMQAWVDEGLFDYLGLLDDVRPTLEAADCVVLPSYYREGTPRGLLEAAAMGRPIITTDMPGCRDVVDDGVNGYLVPPRDAEALARCMGALVDASPSSVAEMGRQSRLKAVRQFDERLVVERYLSALDLIVTTGRTARSGRAAMTARGSHS